MRDHMHFFLVFAMAWESAICSNAQNNYSQKLPDWRIFGAKVSRMDQVKFVEDSL